MANYTEENYNPGLNGYWKGVIPEQPNFGYPQNYFYADTFRSIFLGFGNFFNDLKIIRYNQYGEPQKIINVPIKYGPRQKSHDFRVEQESGDTYYISLPNMTYKLDGLDFDSQRATGIYEQRSFYSDELNECKIDPDMFWGDIQPVPYNITISLAINCEKMNDLNQIIEQILPRFKPAAFFNIKEFWWWQKKRSIKMKLNSPSIQIESDNMGEEDKRIITANLSFTIECVLYNPIKSAPLIQCINTYLSSKQTDILWHNASFGNINGSLSSNYDFDKIYDTKVGNVSALKEGYPITTYDSELSAYTTIYDYEKTNNLTTYDKNSKIIRCTSARWIPPEKQILSATKIYYPDIDEILSDKDISAKAGKILNETIKIPKSIDDYILLWDNEINMYKNTGKKYKGIPEYNDDKEIIGYIPEGEWFTVKKYDYPGINYNKNTDPSIDFGHKILYNNHNEPYSAYYTKYSEEGTYSETSGDYINGNVDFQFSAFDKNIIFSGSKYKI